MKPNDRKQFLAVLQGFCELRGKDLSEEAMLLYWRAMQDWEIADFVEASAHLLKTFNMRFGIPQPSDFEALRVTTQKTAGEIFAEIGRWMTYTPHGYRLNPETPRSIAAAIRACGGVDAIMLGDAEKRPFLERRFCEHYDQISKAEDTRQALPQLAGPAPERKRVAGTFQKVLT